MSNKTTQTVDDSPSVPADDSVAPAVPEKDKPESPRRLDPTRYGDWEKNGRCIDF